MPEEVFEDVEEEHVLEGVRGMLQEVHVRAAGHGGKQGDVPLLREYAHQGRP